MASLAAAYRLSSRVAARQLRREASNRGYRTSAACLAAQNFTMPALSPTMTEGNISKWKFKEGDSFAAGDVLLEIETDKASMDVEAQDDGILMKIMQGDGSKNIQVGTRIGVIAEPGDDVSSLEIPAEENAPPPSSKEAAESKSASTSESQAEAPPASKPSSSAASAEEQQPKSSPSSGGQPKKQTYPLLPSVEHLLHENGLDASVADKITPSGPNGRLLKGDVLAYLGSISKSYPAELSTRIEKLTHLDLSNIKVAPSKAPKKDAAAAAAPETLDEVLPLSQIALPISMAATLEVQSRIEKTLGVYLPLSTFIARATDLANDDLPRSKLAQPTADELFDDILGLHAVSSSSSATGYRGSFLPQITALPATATATVPRSVASPKKEVESDIIDLLTGSRRSVTAVSSRRHLATPLPGPPGTTNIFSVSVARGDEERARVFLERVKAVLETEPGRLVL